MVARRTGDIMLLVSACLVPGLLLTAMLIDWRVLLNAVVAVMVAAATEAACLKLRGRFTVTSLRDHSNLVLALILAAALPPAVPVGVLACAVVIAVALGKHAYGGVGNNVFNPAMVGYAAVLLSFPLALSSWPGPVDALSGATTLTIFKYRGGATVDEIWQSANGFGALGSAGWEWVSLAYLAGGVVLLQKRLGAWRVSAGMLTGLALPALLAYDGGSSASLGSPLYHLFSGGAMLAAFFVVTDPVTHPATERGQWLFGLLAGALTFLIRSFGSHPDGIAFAVLLGTTFALTRTRIDDNVARAANAAVYELLGLDPRAPDAPQPRWRDDVWVLCDGRTVLRRSAPGYAGPINLLAAFAPGPAQLAGVRVVSHLETPGIADFLNDEGPGGWLAALAGRDAATLAQVDTVTGATISSRAVRQTLLELFDARPDLEADCP